MEKNSDQKHVQPIDEILVTKARALAPEMAFVAIIDSPPVSEDGEVEWQAKALCAQIDHDAFFPEKGGSVALAKKACSMCEVTKECLEFALENEIEDGVWGGLTVRERKRLSRQHAA